MAQLNIRIDDDARSALDALAAVRGTTSGELVRALIDEAVGHTERSADPYGEYADIRPRHLSIAERRAMALQHRVLALLAVDALPGGNDAAGADGGGPGDAETAIARRSDGVFGQEVITVTDDGRTILRNEITDGDVEHHLHAVEVLEAGYTAEYPQLFTGIQPALSERACALVSNIMEMFHHLTYGWSQLSDADREQVLAVNDHAEHLLTFHGFDFSDPHESRLVGYARYLVRTDRWSLLAPAFDRAHERGNSHMPVLSHYQRLLTLWRPMWQDKHRQFREDHRPDAFMVTAADMTSLLESLQRSSR